MTRIPADPNLQTSVLALMLGGCLVLLVGFIATLAWRRPDVTIRNILLSGSDVGARPERYVREGRVRDVSRINLFGVCLFLSGVVVIVVETLRLL